MMEQLLIIYILSFIFTAYTVVLVWQIIKLLKTDWEKYEDKGDKDEND